MNRLITILQRNVRARFEVSMDELVTAVTPTLADQASTRARAITYRLLRHALIDRDSVERMLEYPLEWYLVKLVSFFLTTGPRCLTCYLKVTHSGQ